MPDLTYPQARARNELQACACPGCPSQRFGLNLHCRYHEEVYKRYGHPLQGPLKPASWATEREAVRALFASHPNHEGVRRAVSRLDAWMSRAADKEDAYKGAEEIARLHRHCVQPVDLLMELCAVFAYLQRNPSAVRSMRAQDVALSRAVFALAPRPRRQTRGPGGTWAVSRSPEELRSCSYAPKPRASSLVQVGAHLRQTLVVLLVNVTDSLRTPEQRRQAEQDAFRAAFA